VTRYQRSVDIEDLIVVLAGSRQGLTIEEISERYEVSRRTAERMRDAVAERFPLAEVERLDGQRRKRWRIEPTSLDRPVRLDPSELEVLAAASEALAEAGRSDLARPLSRIEARLRLAVQTRR